MAVVCTGSASKDGKMDQNSEALNRSISDSLKRINRARRLRAVMILALGSILFLYSFLPVFLGAIAGAGSIRHRALTGALSILALGNGAILLLFGVRARMFFDQQIQTSIFRTVIFYAWLIGLLFLVDYLVAALLTFLGHQFTSGSI